MSMSWNSQRSGFPGKQAPKGILRVTQKPRRHHQRPITVLKSSDKEEELLVFGYACKIFPADDHARNIAKGRHLIPWNGDENLQLMIDRYDARASLHDLSDFDGDSWNTQYEMSEEESRIEQLCDQERYMAMYTDIAEERIRHEEELKRLHASISGEESTFNQVGFSYDTSEPADAEDVSPAPVEKPGTEDAEEDQDEEEKPFMAPESLAIPPDMEIPPTEKMHAIVEKTATFVSSQGAQMEIILKAKQAKSSQFLFLDFDHYLNPYYKHVLQRIKEGKYRPGMEQDKIKEEESENEDSESDDEGGYLHPSLFASSQKEKKEEEARKREKLKAIQKVDPNHPLAKLIETRRKANALEQYNIMKSAVQNYNPEKDDALEPPPLPKFMEATQNKSNSSSPLNLQEQDALPPRITPQEAAMVIVPPPPDIQPMVDSVAKQIAEEGDAVEQNMREKSDPLLAFLQPSHELHPYYTFRKTFIREQIKAQRRLLQQKAAQEAAEAAEAEKNKQSGPICFSIKGKRDPVPKTTLISTRLQVLGGDSDDGEDDKDGRNKSEDKENLKDPDASKGSENGKPSTKRKFVEITVIEGIAKPSADKPAVPPAPIMTEEDRKRLLAQTRRKFSDTPPPGVVPTVAPAVGVTAAVGVAPVAASISNFTVVTPDGNTMSIAEFREKQAERRKKAALLALQKAKESADNLKTEIVQPKNRSPQDIFDMFEDEDAASEGKKSADQTESEPQKEVLAVSRTSATTKEPSPRSKSPTEEKNSSPPPTAPPAMTLKDLVVAASSSSTPSRDGKRQRTRSRSHEKTRSRSRSRPLSPYARRRDTRSRSRERDYSSYRRILGSSSYHSSSVGRSRYKDEENIPSAYKIENRRSPYRNGSYSSRTRRWEQSPTRHRSHKRRHHDSDKDEKKKRRSLSSPDRKSKKHSKSKKKHKKKKSKSKKKKDKDTSSEEGEWSSGSGSDQDKKLNSKDIPVKMKSSSPIVWKVEKEDGELTPQRDKDTAKT